MGFSEWKKYKFSDFVSINPAISLKGGSEFSFIEMKDLSEGKRSVAPSAEKRITGGARFREGNTLFARITPCLQNGKIGQAIKLKNAVGFGSTEFLVFEEKPKVSDKDFIYYLACWQEVRKFAEQNMVGTSGRQRVGKDAFEKLELTLPPLKTQKVIASILSSIDDKIELNRQTNQTLEAIAQTLFKEICLPNGDVFEDGWTVGRLEEVMENFDSKRKPLSSRQRDLRKGVFPYYGAASIVDYVDDFLFDGVYLLMGEDGTVITPDEKPILQYVEGKFWVNNHAHVLRGKDPYSTEFLYLLLKNKNIKHLVTGAVQPKINQGNMNGLEITIPEKELMITFNELVHPIFNIILKNEQEIKTLIVLRDGLLPRIMKGEITIITKDNVAKN